MEILIPSFGYDFSVKILNENIKVIYVYTFDVFGVETGSSFSVKRLFLLNVFLLGVFEFLEMHFILFSQLRH